MEKENAFGKENGIPILDSYNKVQCSIGHSYLFTLRQFETGYPTNMNVDQSVLLNEVASENLKSTMAFFV